MNILDSIKHFFNPEVWTIIFLVITGVSFISGLVISIVAIVKKRLGILDLLGMGIGLIFLSSLSLLVSSAGMCGLGWL